MSKILQVLASRRMLSAFLLGISSGLPLLLTGSTLKGWLKESGLDLTVIGLTALVGLPYTLKFVWAPLLDRFQIPLLDRRRGWILLCQIALTFLLAAFAMLDPTTQMPAVTCMAFLITFFSATQDVGIDAYRREILNEEELGLGSSLAVNGYRIGMLVSGAGAFIFAEYAGWSATYLLMAAIMLTCALFTLTSPKLKSELAAPRTLREAVVEPFIDYFNRRGAGEILLFILLYKIGDQMASDMFTPFYLDVGFSKEEIGYVSKLFGFWSVIAGGLLGGVLILRMGIARSLWAFGILQALSTAAFAIIARSGHSIPKLAVVVGFENLASGLGTAAYVGFMASLTNRRFTATQYALLSSLLGIPRVFFGASSGYLAKHFGWEFYFTFCALIAVPGMLMLLRMKRWQTSPSVESTDNQPA